MGPSGVGAGAWPSRVLSGAREDSQPEAGHGLHAGRRGLGFLEGVRAGTPGDTASE